MCHARGVKFDGRAGRVYNIFINIREVGTEMKRYSMMILAVIFAAVALMSAPARAEQAATIVKVEGDVKVQRAGKEKAVKGKFPLAWGDKVIVTKGYAMVHFASGKKVKVTSTLEITQAAAKNDAGGAADKVKGSGKKNKDLKAKGGTGGAVRAAAADTSVQILSVLPGSTITTRPVFAWEASAKAEDGSTHAVTPDETAVVLMDENGEELWSSKTKDNVAAFPDTQDPLSGGMEYTIMVTATVAGEPVETSSTFYVFDKDEAGEIKDTVDAIKAEYSEGDDLIIQHMLLAQYFKQNDMFNEAIDELDKLIALDSYDIDSYYELADIYDKTGNKKALVDTITKVSAIEKELGLDDMPSVDDVK